MFCNKCGKTLNPEAKACPSCGQPVGDSRFDGSGYTSSQVRFVPGSAEQQGYAPYTKTTYSSAPDESGDVYSRTSYRPALAEDEGRQTTGMMDAEPEGEAEPDAGEAPRTDAEPEEAPSEERFAPRSETPLEREPGTERDSLGIEIKPLEPIRKTGISPEVQRYIQQMNQRKGRAQRKAQAHEQEDGEPQEGAAEEGAIHEHDADHEGAAAPRGGTGLTKWLVRIASVVAVVALLVAGVLFIADRTANRAKIPGVTYTLYTEGLSMVKQHATDEYRTGIIKLWRADQTGAAAMQQQETESQQISALLPEKPLENDQSFLDTLLAIQKSVEDATTTDAITALGAGSTALSSLSADSEKSWALIASMITQLETSTNAEDLPAIAKGVDLATLATPEPTPGPTPLPYKTLKKGMKNNKQVKNLQDRLYKLGWFNGVRDGDFGPATQTAVKKFQKAIGVEEDGIATPEVQERLYADDAPRGDGKTVAPAETEAPTPAPEGGEAPSA